MSKPFIKAFSPSHFNTLGEPVAEILRFHKLGVEGGLIKRANLFNRIIENYTPSPGKTAVHTIAMTASEKYGLNRNGDGWKKANLIRDCPTFASHAKVYRHHKNSANDPSYGQVKAAMFNDEMDRVELLMELDNKKCAEELTLLEKEGHYPVSMACKIPYDVCTICSNRAKTASEYCDHVQNHLGEILNDGRMVGVDNPQSTFFDISRVIRPADRVAYTLRKVASDGRLTGGAALAEELGYIVPQDVFLESLPKTASERWEILKKMSEMEKLIDGTMVPPGIDTKEDGEVDDLLEKLSFYMNSKLAADSVMRALQDNAIMLSPREYYTLMTGSPLDVKTAESISMALRGLCSNVLYEDDICSKSMYEASNTKVSGVIADLAERLTTKRSLLENAVTSRMIMSDKVEKKASCRSNPVAVNTSAGELAKEYLRYQLETLRGIKQSGLVSDFDRVLICTVYQNTVT